MRAHTIAAGVLLGLSAAALTAPTALADPDTAQPYLETPAAPVAPGGTLEIGGFCAAEDLELSSPVLTGFEIAHEPQSPAPNLAATAAVAQDIDDAIYTVSMTCGDETVSAQFSVLTPSRGEVFISADGSPQPGEDIQVVVRCDGEVDQPESPVLEIGELREIDTPADIATYAAPATIDPDTAPGDYPLTATCDDETLRTTFTVYPSNRDGDGDGGRDGDGDGGRDGDGEQVTRIPKGAPETGGGPDDEPLAGLLALGVSVAVAGAGVAASRRAVRR